MISKVKLKVNHIHRQKGFPLVLFILIFCLPLYSFSGIPKLAIVKYKGGDWYSVERAVKNFVQKVNQRTPLKLAIQPVIIDLHKRDQLFALPFLILNGHGQIILDSEEKENLKKYLSHGGFLLVNDDFGLEKAFKRLIHDLYPELKLDMEKSWRDNVRESYKEVNPTLGLAELTNDFPIYRSYYDLKSLPKVHEHDKGVPPGMYGLFIEKRLVLIYLNNSDLGDGWEPEYVHHDPVKIREKAIRFGINILYYVLSN